MKHFTSFLLFPNHRLLSITFLVIAAGTGATLAITGQTTNKETTPIASEWKTLQTKIDTLQHTINNPLPNIDFSALPKKMQQLSQQLERVRAQNAHHIDQTLNKTEAALVSRLDAVQTLLHQLERKQMPAKYLSPKQLPFQVLSLDSIQSIPVATIAYDFKTLPLEKGDALGGWRVVVIDYGKQRIEFENTQKERVLITHQHMG